jgi:formylglycine-generating enzyme required for sulfatase activity
LAQIVPLTEDIRYHIDKLELIVDDRMWTLPKYRELLFITSATVAVTGVTLQATLTLTVDASQTLVPTVLPTDASNKSVTWLSSAPTIAEVDATGKVTAKAAGTAKITVTTVDGSKTAECTVTVESAGGNAVTGVALQSVLTLTVGSYQTLDVFVVPLDANNKNVTWHSDATGIAEVDATGKVTAKATGTAKITVTTVDGSKTAECNVKVVATGSLLPGEPEMVFVEGGTFIMGNDNGGLYDKPAHPVILSSFSIGKYEVTQGQWAAVMGSNPSFCYEYPSSCSYGDNYPVDRVSWNDIQTFITRLNELTGKNYRLPTDAEWEFAARGGNKSNGYTYSGSNTIGNVAWYTDDYDNPIFGSRPVGGKLPNELGIYDMTGNVWEWCSDWHDAYSSSETHINPAGPSSSTSNSRVQRGGSWMNGAFLCTLTMRGFYAPSYKNADLGFRLVLQ